MTLVDSVVYRELLAGKSQTQKQLNSKIRLFRQHNFFC